MKISDLREYNRCEIGNPVSLDRLTQIKAKGTFAFKMNQDGQPITAFKIEDANIVWFILELSDEIIGYCRLQTIGEREVSKSGPLRMDSNEHGR